MLVVLYKKRIFYTMTKLIVFGLFLGVFSIHNAFAQVVYDIHLDNLLSMQRGLGWPHDLKVAKGHEALMKLRRELPSPRTCTVTTPMGVTFNIQSPPNNRFESWGDNCGIRVRNVGLADEGRWRLSSTSGNASIAGWIELYVVDETTTSTPPPITLHDGETHANVELSTQDNLYCMVAQPFMESSLIPGHCEVTLDRTTRAVQGNWNVLLGLPGRISELHLPRQVAVEAERLDVGYIHDSNTNKLHLFCNILHTMKNVTFCRFQKTTAASGFNIMDGLSDGVHSYYGEGFDNRECGMTIEKPTAQDFGTWRCSVGVQMWVGDKIQPQTPLQALISVAGNDRLCDLALVGGSADVGRHLGLVIEQPSPLQAWNSVAVNTRSQRSTEETEMPTVFTQVDMKFTVMCRADRSLRYCWFQHPNGTQFTPLPLSDEIQLFWYTGENFQAGDCGITFSHAAEEDAGVWTCHMGPSDQVGIEVTDRLNVRVTGPLAAHHREIETSVGESTTLYCHTSNGVRPLEYCRFMTPNFVGLSIDETVTEENAIMDRFYFTPERQLNYGDCSLTIKSVQHEDIGVWTCAALVNEDTVEARDSITVSIGGSSINGQRPFSQAGIAGMVIGLVALLVALGGVVWYKRHTLFPPKSSNTSTDLRVSFSASTMSTTGSCYSSDLSSMSEVEIDIRGNPTGLQRRE